MMNISIVTLLYLPLGYLFLTQINIVPPSNYYLPLDFKPLALYLLLFLGFLLLVAMDSKRKQPSDYFWQRFAIIAVTILVFLTTVVGTQIISRHDTGVFDQIHDGAQMTEVAGEMLLAGKNPYAENFQATLFGQYNAYADVPGVDNPAWYHFIYLPFYTLFSTVFQALSLATIGWYDLRFILIIAFGLSSVILFRLIPKHDDKLLAIFLLAFNPIFIFFFIAGYNDIFVYCWLLLTWYLLWRKKYGWSAFILGLALLSKQSAWLVIPFYFFYLYYQLPVAQQWLSRAWRVVKKLWPTYVAVGLLALPFIIWAPGDLYSDVISYAAGTSEHRFPIYGEGFSQVLYQAGLIQSIWDAYPFWLWQLIVGLPLLLFLLWWQKKDNTITRLIINYGIFLMVFWLFSRFFNPNYVGYISLIMLAAWAFYQREALTRSDKS